MQCGHFMCIDKRSKAIPTTNARYFRVERCIFPNNGQPNLVRLLVKNLISYQILLSNATTTQRYPMLPLPKDNLLCQSCVSIIETLCLATKIHHSKAKNRIGDQPKQNNDF